ncbi:hypothetical protein AXK12_06255 [Cephaloticoccus capnophilus]|uniref:Exopolysaccharide biosynthesis protein exod n=1 Tax=Cephaloticoccus capnophilus TaxID=1548208 RepID=A0A139SKA8_9BACT|nr:exopolysaccharide biosynthesis protein [Cephaloticoccus capnophilus]KXU34966.1 hypothetical protein AXK12_06255 [Cephaloticoccus capnophilus]
MSDAPAPQKLSVELARLRDRLGNRPVTLCEVIATLRGRAYVLVVILFALPFVTPIPLPGLSTPLGLVIGFIALRQSLGLRPWLPKSWQRRELPAGFFKKTFTIAGRVIAWLERVLRPRLAWVSRPALAQQAHAVVILICAIILLLPLPIPFSNTFPAWAILLIASGNLERDGLFILLGYIASIAGLLYLLLLGTAAQKMSVSFWHWLNA